MLEPRISIRHVPSIPGSTTPARCNRRTGEILINDSRWSKIEPAHRVFILLHEYAHIALNSSDEFEVDKLAHKIYLERGYPLTESVRALSKVLTGSSESHVQRVQAQLNRAYDVDKNNTQKKESMCNCNGKSYCARCSQNKTGTFLDQANGDVLGNMPGFFDDDDQFTEDLFGLGKKAQARRTLKLTLKYGVKQAKADGTKALKEGKGAGLQAKGLAKQTLAEQGIVDTSTVGGLVDSAKGILGKGGGADGSDGTAAPSKKPMMIAIVVGAVLVIGGIIYFVIKKKKK